MNTAFIFGLLASVCITWLAFTTKQKTILVLSAILGVVTATQYALLNEGIAMSMSVISLGYALVMLFFSEKYPILTTSKMTVSLLAAYTVVFFALNGVAFNLQLLAYIGSVTMVAVMLVKNPYLVKWLMLIAGVAWSIFQCNIGAYGQLFGQAVYFIGVFYSFWKLNQTPKSSLHDQTLVKEYKQFSSV